MLDDIKYIGVYFSPNRNLAEFETFLDDVGDMIRRRYPHPVVISGDFNAKSTAW